jgi:hypothetical protein
MRILAKKSITALVGATALALSAQGAMVINQSNPYELSGDVYVENTLTNNSGVTLDSASFDYSQLLFDIANTDYNVARFDTNADNIVEFGTDNLVTQLSDYLRFSVLSTGDVYNGWTGDIGSDGIVNIDNFSDSRNDHTFSNNSDMDTRLILDNYLVENPSTNTIVPISLDPSQTITDFASGSENSTALPFTADGLGYEVVPEVSFYGLLLGAVSLGWAVSKRRR